MTYICPKCESSDYPKCYGRRHCEQCQRDYGTAYRYKKAAEVGHIIRPYKRRDHKPKPAKPTVNWLLKPILKPVGARQ